MVERSGRKFHHTLLVQRSLEKVAAIRLGEKIGLLEDGLRKMKNQVKKSRTLLSISVDV
jgi:hypothetical protein